MPNLINTSHNGIAFGVSSEPMPSRLIGAKSQSGKARLGYATEGPNFESDLQDFEEAILGWTRIDPLNPDRLNRNFPYCWPLHNQGSMNALQLTCQPTGRVAHPETVHAVGGINEVTVNNPSPNQFFPSSRGYLYDCDFGQLPYGRFMTDAEAYAGPNPPRELGRCVTVVEVPVPREMRRSDYGFETVEAEPQPVLQVGFVPFLQAEVSYRWFQVPYPEAVPFHTIESLYLHVNATHFDDEYSSYPYSAGTLLFTRTTGLDDWYWGPGGRKYTDLTYNFTYNPFGWNKYLRADGTSVSLRRRNVPGIMPPYLPGEFDDLFNPSNP